MRLLRTNRLRFTYSMSSAPTAFSKIGERYSTPVREKQPLLIIERAVHATRMNYPPAVPEVVPVDPADVKSALVVELQDGDAVDLPLEQ